VLIEILVNALMDIIQLPRLDRPKIRPDEELRLNLQ
jgi:hypothetical protein